MRLEKERETIPVNFLPARQVLVLDGRHSQIFGLFTVNFGLAGPDISVMGLDNLSLLPHLPPSKCHNVEGDSNIGSDEGLVVEIAVFCRVVDKHTEAASEDHQDTEEERNAGTNDPQRSFVGQCCLIDTLCTSGANEEDVSNQEGDPCQHYDSRSAYWINFELFLGDGREGNIHPKIDTISVKYPKTSLEPLETLIKASKQNEDDSARA